MSGAPRRRILRFFGPRGDLLAAEGSSVFVYDASGQQRIQLEAPGLIDVAGVGDELWIVVPGRLVRRSARDGRVLSDEAIEYLDPNGRFVLSSVAPLLPVWQGAKPTWLRAGPARTEVPGTGGDLILPLSEGRWMLWQGGQLKLWRTIGEAWRRPVGEPGSRALDAQLVLDGRMFVLAQQRAGGDAELRLTVAAVSDGTTTTQMRLPGVTQVWFAARRGIALARTGERLSVIDLRFGRWIRDLALPPGTTDIAVDEGLQRLAIGTADGLELVRPDTLATQPAEIDAVPPDTTSDAHIPNGQVNGAAPSVAAAPRVEDDAASVVTAPDEAVQVAAAPPAPTEDDVLPDAPLVRLDPVSVTQTATAREVTQSIEGLVQLIGARVGVAIAEAWDSGRLSRPDPMRPPFVDEVGGLLGIIRGRAENELGAATQRLRATEDLVASIERQRAGRLTALDVLARDFNLNQVAVATLMTILAPRLRGELARLYGILANDPGRPMVDEYLIGQILGPAFGPQIARELDADRPLRRYGLVRVAPGDRPFASLTCDPLVARFITNQPPEGEPDTHLRVRQVDRDLEELQVPRAVMSRAMRYLAAPRDDEPARIVVRGRTGSGRHTLLTSLGARAGRSLGVIDLGAVPREAGRLGAVLETLLRRAMLRGLLPCVDGLDTLSSTEDPDTKIQVSAALRQHPGPLAIRLPLEASIPLDPGYLLLDLPARNEQERARSWEIALEHHRIELSDTSDLASRYRVGPGIIERVCAEVSRRPDRPTDPVSWVRELDDGVRQHLENRLGATASRVTRLASWADVVLPEDITDSLLELTARVRHRKKVYEQWGFDRSITTARGITALFAGSPGTGKTMVAGVIARDLGLELYRVDVSRISSKWIGETEKNLGSLFDAAEDGQVMLLFDEADSLFAKRTEVKSSVDRYANMEVNYLLQRLDSFEGIAILTTNFGTAIDPAFKRRLTYRVTFPFPDEEMREQLWRSLIPPQVPVSGRIDFAALSHRFRLSGGYIRNATLRAAFLAAEEGTALTHDHLERAIRMEFREIGKLAESGTLE